MPAITTKKYQRRAKNGVLFLSRKELEEYFELQAKRLVGLSGEEALDRIRRGQAGKSLGWASLSLLAPLLNDQE